MSPHPSAVRFMLFLSVLISVHLWFSSERPGRSVAADALFDRHMAEARARLRAQDYAAAVPALQAALAREPYSVVAHDALGVAYSQLAQYSLAIEEFKAALRINPKLALTHNNLGYVYLQLGRWDTAASEFQQALQIEPDNDTASANLGRAYAAQGRRAEAVRAFAAALRRNPKNAEARQGLTDLGPQAQAPPDAFSAAEAAPHPSAYQIIVTDPTRILKDGAAAPYYPLGPTQSCLVEMAPGSVKQLDLAVWLPQPDRNANLYWSFVPAQPGAPRPPRSAPLRAAAPPVSRTISGVRLFSAGTVKLTLSPGVRQCFLSASQPAYITIKKG